MGRIGLALAGLLAAALVSGGCQRPAEIERLVSVSVHGSLLRCYLADTVEERLTGLQGFEITADEGMLFTWAEPALRTFEIKDVGYPIEVIWIDEDRRVAGVSPLAPGGPEIAESPGAVSLAVETRAGWAERTGVQTGDAVVIAEPR